LGIQLGPFALSTLNDRPTTWISSDFYGARVSNTTSKSGLQTAAVFAGVLAIPVTVAAIVLAEAQGKPAVLIPLGMWGVAAAVAIFRASNSSAATVGTIVAASLLAFYGVVIVVWPDTFNPPPAAAVLATPAPTPSATVRTTPPPPPPAPEIVFTYPAPDQEQVDACFQVQFTGRPADGWTFIVSNRRREESVTYFEGDVVSDGSGRRWSAHTALAQNDASATGALFYLEVWMLPKDLAAYLLETHTDVDADETWWKSKQAPPSAIHVERVQVHRSRKAAC
jgi:hypothetical protein